MLLALFRIFWIRNELLWICLIILQKVLARKNPKIAIGNFTPSFPAAHCNRWSLPKRDLIYPSVTLFFSDDASFFYMTAEVSVLLIPAVPVCQSSIESPQCSFFPYCYAMYYSLASFLSGIRQRIELQTTILQLAHPSFWQQINKRSTRGQLYKSWVAFPLMTNYQNVFYSLAHNTYLTDGEVRATKRDITCRFLIGWFLSFVVVSRFLLIFLPPPHIYYI